MKQNYLFVYVISIYCLSVSGSTIPITTTEALQQDLNKMNDILNDTSKFDQFEKDVDPILFKDDHVSGNT